MSRAPTVLLALAIAACDDEGTGAPPGPAPQIVAVAGPASGIAPCDPAATGATCPLPITVTFRLAEPEFVWKAYVRFQGDGTDRGVDRGYLVPYAIGKGTNDVQVVVNASVPPNLLRRGAQFTYSVRLVTGSGAESSSTTLSVSVP